MFPQPGQFGFFLSVMGLFFVSGLEDHSHVHMMCLTIYRGNFECSSWTLFLVQWRFLIISVNTVFYLPKKVKSLGILTLRKETMFLLDSLLALEE